MLIFTTRDADEAGAQLERAGARVEHVAGRDEHCDLAAVLARLAELEVNDVWVEAGPRFNGALLRAGLIDELVLYVAPKLLGDSARGMFAHAAARVARDVGTLRFDEIR